MINFVKKHSATAVFLLLTVSSSNILADTVNGIVLDAAGNNASATDLAQVACFDNGNGPTAYLGAQIEDSSPPVPGLLVNVQIFKDNKMTNISDPVSADGKPSPFTILQAGDGVYFVSVNKTNVGSRTFSITYHCLTGSNVHTGTDISAVLQIQ